MKEILTIGKICWEVREAIEGRSDIDLVVVDATATGHIVAQLGAPAAIRELVDVGPVRDADAVAQRDARGSRDHRGQRRHDARGDAGRGDDRARRTAARRDRRSRSERSSSTGCCPSCSPTPTKPTFEALREPDVRARLRSARRRRHHGRSSTRPASRCRSGAPGPCTSNACSTRSTFRCSTCRTSSCAPTACASRAWSPTRSAQELGL